MKMFSLSMNTRIIFYGFFAVKNSFVIPLGFPLFTNPVYDAGGVFWGLKMIVDLRAASLV